MWEVETRTEKSVTLTLDKSPTNWSHKFLLTYTVTLNDKSINIELSAKNCNPEDKFSFTSALHTYFK